MSNTVVTALSNVFGMGSKKAQTVQVIFEPNALCISMYFPSATQPTQQASERESCLSYPYFLELEKEWLIMMELERTTCIATRQPSIWYINLPSRIFNTSNNVLSTHNVHAHKTHKTYAMKT